MSDYTGIRILSLEVENAGTELLKIDGLFDNFRFSPDGQILASFDRAGILQLWNISTGENFYRLDTNTELSPARFRYESTMAFSPDGSMLVLGNPLYVLRLDTGEIVPIIGDYPLINPRFSPDGSSLFIDTYQSTMVFGIPNDLRTPWEPITGQVNSSGVNLRSFPDADAAVIGFASGEVRISGRAYNQNAVYLPDSGGWIWADPAYLDLGEAEISDLPVLYVPESAD